jgi:transposase-like protein
LQELGLVEQRYHAVLEVLDGATVVDVARRFGVARQRVHVWLVRHARHGLAGLADKSSRPLSCPHQLEPAVEVRRGEEQRRVPRLGQGEGRFVAVTGARLRAGGANMANS